MIAIHRVSKRFGRRVVLDDLELALTDGDRVALIGSNGAGKTTLIRCILGEYHFQGSIQVDGLDLNQNRVALLRRIGFVPQLPPPLKMHVGELVALTARLAGVPPTATVEAAARLGLDVHAFRHHSFRKLSGGMKQKLLIAIALGKAPAILILDEPTANLDPEARKAFFALLAEIPPATVMLLSSHRLDELAGLVNRVVEMDQGRVVLDERIGEIVAGQLLNCRLRAHRTDPPLLAELEQWGFRADGASGEWLGEVAAPDRIRFLGTMARFSGQLDTFAWITTRQGEPAP